MTDFLMNFFGSRLLFPVLVFVTAAMSAGAAGYLLAVKEENVDRMEKLPRWKIPGFILGIFVVAWCVPHAMPILPDSLHKYLVPLMGTAVILSWFVLDHLFARALGGYMILTAHLFLRETFGVESVSNPFFAGMFLIYGTMGIFLCGLPYRLRDLVRLECSRKYRWIVPGFLILLTLTLLWAGIDYLRVSA